MNMAQIKIDDLQNHATELSNLSLLEMENITGGGLFSSLSRAWKKLIWNPIKEATGVETPSFLKDIDDVVNNTVGWPTLLGIGRWEN
jgi:hypothetical protein